MKLDMVRRFAFIETRLLWGGGLTAQELGHAFGISRQSAQAVIDDYRNHHPGNMFLNRSTRRQEAANSFQAAYIREGSCALLDYLRGQSLVTHYMAEEVWSDLPFTDADRLTRARIPNDTVRLVITALYQKSTLSVVYQSKRYLLTTVTTCALTAMAVVLILILCYRVFFRRISDRPKNGPLEMGITIGTTTRYCVSRSVHRSHPPCGLHLPMITSFVAMVSTK